MRNVFPAVALPLLLVAGCSDPHAPVAAPTASPSAAARVVVSPALRDTLYRRMSYMGGRAAGLVADRDRDFTGPFAFPARATGGFVPYVIGGADVDIDGTEVGTQSETSIAANATGTILIGGYNDANGFPTPPATSPTSVSGVARSSDGGATWAPVPVGPNGLGVLPVDATGNGQVFGDPDVKYDPTRDLFYYASIYVRPSDGIQGMSISRSNAGATAGTSWSQPIEVTPTFGTNRAGDKELIDVNAQTGRLLLAWTDFPTTGSTTNIKATYSDDAGATWSTAATIASVGGTPPTNPPFLQASIPRFLPAATNAASTAYIVWRTGDNTTRNIGCARSTNGGASWSAGVNLDSTSYADEDQILGVDRVATSPSMAIDYTSGKVYVVYQRNNSVGTGDVALRTFTGACVAGAPVLLDGNPGNDRAQFMPWVTVDQSNGHVHVIWYDQAHDATGDVTEVMHTMSTDQGATWSPPTPLVDRPFHAGYGNDTGQPNMGDYIQAVAQGGKLHTLWGGTSVEPRFDDGLPARSLVTPDTYYDVRLDTDEIAPLRLAATAFSEASCAALGNGNIDPGETIALAATLQNYVTNAAVGATTVTGISGTLSTSTSGVTITSATSPWADLAAGASGANTTPFQFQVGSSFVPGTPIDFVLAVTTNQGVIQLPIRATTGTPGTASPLINESFDGVTAPNLPTGWSAQTGAGTADPWVTSNSFTGSGLTGNYAFHGEGTAFEWMRLWSPTVTVPTVAGQAYVSVDFDLAYRLEDDAGKVVQAYDGLTLRLTDMTGGTAVRSVLAEAFAQKLATGAVQHFPKHLPRSSNASYFEDMSVWSGNSNGLTHVAMRFPAQGLEGKDVQLRFEYTQDGAGTCGNLGYATPCGVGVDNVKVQVVPLVDARCPNADLSITKSDAPDPVVTSGQLTYTIDVANAGPSAASNVKVVDTLPAGVAFVSASGTNWTCGVAAGVVTCTMPSLASGASGTITVVVTAPATAGSITNTATVTAAEFDPVSVNNTASAQTTVGSPPACGNGVVESGEQCDDGSNNGTAGDCCASGCTFQPATTLCRAGSCTGGVATLPAMCTGSSASCPASTTQACAPYVCDVTACKTSCATPADCVSGYTCISSACAPIMDMATLPDLSPPPDLTMTPVDLASTPAGDLSAAPGDDLAVGGGSDDLAVGGGGGADLAGKPGNAGGCGCQVPGSAPSRPQGGALVVGLALGFFFLRRRGRVYH